VDEEDARTLNTHIVQRKHAIPHSMMKSHRNIIDCGNNTHEGAPHTGKQTNSCASDQPVDWLGRLNFYTSQVIAQEDHLQNDLCV